MAIYRKGRTWYIDFYANGRRVRKSTKTENKKKAQRLHDKLKEEIWHQRQLGSCDYVWQQAVVRYLKESIHKKDYPKEVQRLNWLRPHLDGMRLNEITANTIRHILEDRLKDVSPATANRYLATIRGILRKTHREWNWIDVCPTVKPFPEPQKRIRWLTHADASELIKDASESLKPIITLALATGLRESNIRLLEWSQIDMPRKVAWIHADQAKAKKPIGVPLNKSARSVIRSQIGRHELLVFGERDITSNVSEWRDLGRKYNIRFHDLRHTWASWHVQSGTPLQVLKELGGWATLKMVERYAHLAPEHLAEYAGNTEVSISCPKPRQTDANKRI